MKLISKLSLLGTLLLLPVLSFGHGGVSMDQDVCIMKLGNMKSHFTGYQPEYRATQEFCEDIPVVGKSIFVIDFISEELREMIIDFRVIKDVKEIGNNATYEDLGGDAAIEAATIYYQEGQLFPRGTLSANYNFTQEGRYVGIVTARYDDDSPVFRSVFPFQVGLFDYWQFVIPILIILVLSSAGFGIFLGIAKNQKLKES